jgi:membrane protease YdiL (CAAX protease family)
MKPSSVWFALLGSAVAIAITATMDAHGLTLFSALPLLPLTIIFWVAQRISATNIGLRTGRGTDYVVALVYPFAVLAACTLAAFAAGAVHLHPVGNDRIPHIAINAFVGVLAALLTEEGFFRGWLWASLAASSVKPVHILAFTSIVFAAWHISYATMAAGYILPPGQVAIFIANAAIMGAIWGMMRARSRSILVPSVSHSVWNAIAYALFGEGPKLGLLGITQTATFGAEVGVVGLLSNVAFALALFLRYRSDFSSGSLGGGYVR